jgi:HAD superfamily hydrolase (TIGR01509 family)
MIKAALVDMDGTLYDSMPFHSKAWHRLMNEIGIEAPEDEFYLDEGMTGAATVNKLAMKAWNKCFSKEECDALYARKAAYFRELGAPGLMPGADRVIAGLMRRGIVCVLVTGSGQNSLLCRLDGDFPDAFPECRRVTARDVSNGKPHPEPFLRGAALAGVRPEECIAIDNAPLGVESASRAGTVAIGVCTGPIPAYVLEKAGASRVYGSMDELADGLDVLLDSLTML